MIKNFFTKFGMVVVFSLLINGCALIQEKFSSERDADLAYKIPEAYVNTFRFSDLIALQIMLQNRLTQYNVGISYIKKQLVQLPESKRPHLEKRAISLVRNIHVLEAEVDNLSLLYPEDWENIRQKMNEDFKELRANYQSIFEDYHSSLSPAAPSPTAK